MPLNYSIVLLGNPRKPDDPKKAYARSQVSKELTLKGLSQRVAAQTRFQLKGGKLFQHPCAHLEFKHFARDRKSVV